LQSKKNIQLSSTFILNPSDKIFIIKPSKMNKRRLFLLSSLLTVCFLGIQAQVDESGKKVRSITFDREQVTVTFNDGTKSEAVKQITVRGKQYVTGITETKSAQLATQSRWYAIDGRNVQPGRDTKKGVYVVREGNKVRKTIKK
jgi:hypothetical protein